MSSLTSPTSRRELEVSAGGVWTLLGVAGPVTAALAMGYAHLISSGLSPLTGLVSDYARHDGAHAALLVSILALAMGCLWTTFGLALADPARTAATRVLLTVAALGLVLTAIFPTDPAPGVTSMGGEIHRWSAAAVFVSLPCAGWTLARNRPAIAHRRLIRGLSLTAVLLLSGFLAAHPGSPTSELLAGPAYYGLLQRLLLLAVTALALLIALGGTTPGPEKSEGGDMS